MPRAEADVEFLGARANPRKLRLVASACCRLLWDQLLRENSQKAVIAAEQFADRLVSKRSLLQAGNAARRSRDRLGRAGAAARCCAYGDAWSAALFTGDQVAAFCPSSAPAQATLVRDVFGNPFRPVCVSPAVLTPTVLALAQAAYDNRALPAGTLETERLAVLADALEDAGASGPLLEHLRSPGPHVRGCHALDAILGRK
jgi:hypothetical protein